MAHGTSDIRRRFSLPSWLRGWRSLKPDWDAANRSAVSAAPPIGAPRAQPIFRVLRNVPVEGRFKRLSDVGMPGSKACDPSSTLHRRHSLRSDTLGSTLLARRAGT
jgi:hypothetical protein